MSAFIVPKAHIDALVHVALLGPANATNWYPPRFGNQSRKLDAFNVDELGQLLTDACIASVNYRYSHHPPEPLPVYKFPECLFTAGRVEAVVYLKAISCYEYQSCELPTWKDSPAQQFCNHLQSALIGELPGYDAAPWSLEDVPTR